MDVNQAQLSDPAGPARVAIHGPGGTGKTTTACYLPSPIIVGAENGIPRDLGFRVPMLRPRTWTDLINIIHSLTHDKHEYETLGIDTVDWIEPMLHAFVCERDSGRETEMNRRGKPLLSIEDYGYGRGFLAAEEEFVRLLTLLDVLQYRRRMHIVMLMHSTVRTFKNPTGPDFDRYEPKCQTRVADKVVEWAENVLFLHYRIDASKVSEDKERSKADPSRARVKGVDNAAERLVGCNWNALYTAKNRVRLPDVIPLGDPNVLVSHLLGLELGADVQSVGGQRTQRESIAQGPAVDARPRTAQPPREAEPPRSSNYERKPEPRNEQALPPPKHNGKSDLRVVQDEVPAVPAHHPSRIADEMHRQEDAFARARGAVEERDARRAQGAQSAPSSDAAKTEARTWTEPKRPNAEASSTPTRDEQDLIRAVTSAITRADKLGGAQLRDRIDTMFQKARQDGAAIKATVDLVDAFERGVKLGPQFRGQMFAWLERWFKDFPGDWSKLGAIPRRIDKSLAEAAHNAQNTQP